MAVVLPAYFVPKEGERLCMTTRGKDEGARAGGRVSGANIPFLHSHLLMHTHTHMHACTDPLTRTRGAQKMCTW